MSTGTNSRTILVTESDMKLLRSMLDLRKGSRSHDEPHLEMLAHELEHAIVVPAADISRDVVTMNSQVLIEDLDTGVEVGYTLAFPSAADRPGKLSILAPLGTALLGYREGDVIEWPVPRGVRRVRVREVLYQPEADEPSWRFSLAVGGKTS
jgi:regulator of nucleoside diphosphate kinase